LGYASVHTYIKRSKIKLSLICPCSVAFTNHHFGSDVDTKQYTLSSYGALELSNKGSIEAVLGVAKATHKVGKSNTLSADQGSNGSFTLTSCSAFLLR
jgi:hypothetical protein